MNVDYDLYEGETASASVRHTFSRGTLVYDRGEIMTEPGHGRFVPRSLGPPHGRRVTELRLDPQAVIADLDELATKSGGRFAGAKRLAWTPDWMETRAWLARSSSDRPRAGARRGRQPVGPDRRRRGPLRDRRVAHRRGAGRRLARRRARADDRARDRSAASPRGHDAANRRAVRRLGRRGGRALHAAACSAPRRAPGRWFPTTSATCATPRA